MHWDNQNRWYIEYTKLSNGQTAMLVLEELEKGKTLYYSVLFGIANKKKTLKNWLYSEGDGNFDIQCTGNSGTEGLLWAFRKLKEFIEEHEHWKTWKSHNHKIIVQGSDQRRYRIYKHFLKRLGFVEELDPEWGWLLAKSFK